MAVQPSHTRLLYGLIRDGRLAEAVERLQGVLRVGAPSRRRCRRGGGEASGRRQEALALRSLHPRPHCPQQPMSQMAPGSRTALSLLAHCYYRQEDYEAAAQTYEALTTRCPGVPEYRLYWAQSLAKAGQWGEAKRVAASVEGFHQASGAGVKAPGAGVVWRLGAGLAAPCTSRCPTRLPSLPLLPPHTQRRTGGPPAAMRHQVRGRRPAGLPGGAGSAAAGGSRSSGHSRLPGLQGGAVGRGRGAVWRGHADGEAVKSA